MGHGSRSGPPAPVAHRGPRMSSVLESFCSSPFASVGKELPPQHRHQRFQFLAGFGPERLGGSGFRLSVSNHC